MGLVLELLMVLSLLSLLLTPVWYLYNAFETKREISYERERIVNLQRAFENSFSGIIDHVRNVCADGFQDTSCRNTLPYPVSVSNSGKDLVLIYSLDTNLPNRDRLRNYVVSLFSQADCRVSGESANFLNFICRNLNIVSTYAVPATSLDNPFPITVRAFRTNGTEKDYQISITEYEARKARNRVLFEEIANAMKEYHLRRRIEEAYNPCQPNGGLHSQDDIYIPWIMQAYTSSPNELCNTSTSTSCSCTNINWSFVDQTLDTYKLALSANLGITKLVDYFGNKLDVYAIVDTNDNPFTPPNPQENYPLKPPYFGLIQIHINHTCKTNKEDHCYYKFVYPN